MLIKEYGGERGQLLTRWRDFYELTKPGVVKLLVFTAIVGMCLSTPGWVPWQALLFGTVGIGLASGSAAALNHVLDRNIDAGMRRTQGRPLPTGHLSHKEAVAFAIALGGISMAILYFLVNPLTALLTFVSLIGYAIIYTVFLKRMTPQNIVIGGAAGAAPPILGWTAVTNEVSAFPVILFMIIFAWTPPHFWALAIARKDEYAKVDIPMLPVTHGEAYTRSAILAYTLLLIFVSVLPAVLGMSGITYLIGAVLLGAGFLYYAVAMKFSDRPDLPMRTFGYSITYLMILFALLLVDHYLPLFFEI
jgi:protoheme IX farnesyltransferase